MTDSIPTTPSTVPTTGFSDLGLDTRLVEPLAAAGYTTPTPVQRESIPHLAAGRDLIGLAATGTGKTAAFALPLLHRLAQVEGRKPVSVLILVPTRELAMQVAAAVEKYGQPIGTKVVAIYGGAGYGDQIRGLRRADVVVATPGRAIDHLTRGTLVLDNVSAVVLDEADEMLDMGFAEDIDTLLSATPKARQTALFSATMPPRIAAIADKHLSNAVRIQVAKAAVAPGEAPKVKQLVYVVPREFKTAAVARLLEVESPASALVFCRTRDEADAVADALAARGHRPESLHGGIEQAQREKVMKRFRDGAVTLLVATDVAARGLDISHLSHVVNYGVPQQTETYVHRVGRVGRAGREGTAITVCEPRERRALHMTERMTGGKLEYPTLPTPADVKAKRIARTREALTGILADGGLDEFLAVIGPLAANHAPADVAAAAVALAVRSAKSADDEIDIPTMAERPVRRPDAAAGPRGVGVRPSRFASSGTAAKIFIGIGRMAGVSRPGLVQMIGNEVGLPSRDIGNIQLGDRHSIVEVPEEAADHAIDVLSSIRWNGRRFPVRRDRAPMMA